MLSSGWLRGSLFVMHKCYYLFIITLFIRCAECKCYADFFGRYDVQRCAILTIMLTIR